MDDHQGSPTNHKKISIDKIFETITTDLQNAPGQYVHFEISNQQNQSCNWTQFTPSHLQYTSSLSSQSSLVNISSLNQMSSPFFVQDMPQYNSSITEHIYFPNQNVTHLGINENNDLIGTIDIGGGNFINVIYGNTNQFMSEQCQLSSLPLYRNKTVGEQEYELFNNQQNQVPVSSGASNQNLSGKQLIDNLVGNWVPNQSGTYSPFGISSNVTSISQLTSSCSQAFEERSRCFIETQARKPRVVAEVKPMRPSYSDVLIKSIPNTPPAFTTLKQKQENFTKKVSSKSLKNKTKTLILNACDNDDHDSPKQMLLTKSDSRFNSNLSRRWVSLDNISSSNDSLELTFDRSNNYERKKNAKLFKKTDKGETLNNSNVQNNIVKNVTISQKRPIQINNNLSTTYSFNQNLPLGSKIFKNKQPNNKVKEEKKNLKDKNLKHCQAEKVQQLRKNQRSRRKENRGSAIKEMLKAVQKYSNRWSNIGLKILFWLLLLISDVFSMSINLVIQFGKCSWFRMIGNIKCSWLYIISTIAQIRFLNAFGKKMNNWFGKRRFAFWKRLSTEIEIEESTNWIGGLDANIALPSTGEEAMKRLLACKGKDPYCILGVTPTCTDDDIKKYYKRQAFLVHPDKNNQPGAEEAFKILVHAFDIIGEPERRQAFDQTRQVQVAWGELNDLISQLHRKMEQAANTIRCTNCGLRHKRIPTHRPCYAARFCSQCKIRHSAKEGDIWAESRFVGFLWHYYACMEGAVYDVTDWAACQAGNLKHLRANMHIIQYRIVLGQRPSTSASTSNNNRKRPADSTTSHKEEFEDFLNKLYNKTGSSSSATNSYSMKGDNRRRKTKRKK